jgi:hypothetical protein
MANVYSFTGPNGGPVNSPSGVFTVTPQAAFTGTITPTATGLFGTFSPTSLTWSGSLISQTFEFTPSAAGLGSIDFTNTGGFTAPTALSYNAVTLPIAYITNSGGTAINTAGASGPTIQLTTFKLGSDVIIGDSPATLEGLTSVQSGGTNASVYTGTTAQIQYSVLGPNEVMYLITLDETVGTFNIGNIGLYTNTGVLFCIVALPSVVLKTQSSGAILGNRRTYEVLVNFTNAASLLNLTILNEYAYNLATVPTEIQLPSAVNPPYNVYLVQSHTLLGIPVLAVNYNNIWNYIPTQSPYPEIGGGIAVPASCIASNVNANDAVYYNVASNQFQLADGTTGYTKYPIGIKGNGSFIYFAGSSYTAIGTPYTAGATYYLKNGGVTGNVTTAALSGNISSLIGYATSTSTLYIFPYLANSINYGSFVLNNASGTVLSLSAAGNTISVQNLAASGQVESGILVGTLQGDWLYNLSNVSGTSEVVMRSDGSNVYMYPYGTPYGSFIFGTPAKPYTIYSYGIINATSFQAGNSYLNNTANGPQLVLSGTGNQAPPVIELICPNVGNKYIVVNTANNFAINNSNNTAEILQLSDSGNLSITGSVTSTGATFTNSVLATTFYTNGGSQLNSTANGYQLLLTGNGTNSQPGIQMTMPGVGSKYLRIETNNNFAIVNSANTADILTLTDTGILSIPSVSSPNVFGTVVSAGTILYVGPNINIASNSGTGYQLTLQGISSGAQAGIQLTCPGYTNKYIRATSDGNLDIVNSANNAQIVTFTDTGVLTLAGQGTSGNQVPVMNQFALTGSANGYMIIPRNSGSFLIQWGNYGCGASSNVYFPRYFPVACMNVMVSEGNASGSWGLGHVTVHGTSGFNTTYYIGSAYSWNGSSWISGTISQNFIAVGY